MVRLEDKLKSYTVNLSGGQKQRLALGISLLNNPKLLLLDEPTTGLDPNSRREIWGILSDLKNNFKTTMILTTHYMDEAAFLCDRIVIMDLGKIIASGTLDQLLSDTNHGEIIEFVTEENFEIPEIKNLPFLSHYFFDLQNSKYKLGVDSILVALPKLMDYCRQNSINFSSLECRKKTLDDLFTNLTGRRLHN